MCGIAGCQCRGLGRAQSELSDSPFLAPNAVAVALYGTPAALAAPPGGSCGWFWWVGQLICRADAARSRLAAHGKQLVHTADSLGPPAARRAALGSRLLCNLASRLCAHSCSQPLPSHRDASDRFRGSAVAPRCSILAPVDPEVTRGLSRASACHTTLYRGRGRGGEPSWKQGADMTLYFVNYEIVHGIVH